LIKDNNNHREKSMYSHVVIVSAWGLSCWKWPGSSPGQVVFGWFSLNSFGVLPVLVEEW